MSTSKADSIVFNIFQDDVNIPKPSATSVPKPAPVLTPSQEPVVRPVRKPVTMDPLDRMKQWYQANTVMFWGGVMVFFSIIYVIHKLVTKTHSTESEKEETDEPQKNPQVSNNNNRSMQKPSGIVVTHVAMGGCNCPVHLAQQAQQAKDATHMQTYYQGQGPLPANTYTFTTAGPRYKVSMGTCPQNVAAIGSSLQNTTGQFGNPQCY